MISHIVLSYSRTVQLREIVNLLVINFPDDRVLIADSGRRGEEIHSILGQLYEKVTHVETDASDAIANMIAMEDSIVGPSIFYHDDDLFYPEKIKKSLDLAGQNKAEFMFSMKADRDSFGLHSQNYDVIPVKSILLSYLLDPYSNCPLITGIYFRTKASFIHIMNFEQIYGKYSDVLMMSTAVKQIRNIQVGAYMRYIEHDGNDNNTRDLAGRDGLSVALRTYKDHDLDTLSLLVYHGYLSRLHYYILGLVLIPTSRLVLTSYVSKLMVKLSKKCN
jgi:hypothetical protein